MATGTKSFCGSYGSFLYSDGLIATCELLATSNSCPSAGALLTVSIARKPLAPGFESTITGCPHSFASLSAIVRENTDGAAPAAYGASNLTGFDGNDWASANNGAIN